jgi:hypothetical protein
MRKPWTTSECAIVERYYPDGIRATKPHLPNRTTSAIRSQAGRLGVGSKEGVHAKKAPLPKITDRHIPDERWAAFCQLVNLTVRGERWPGRLCASVNSEVSHATIER